MAQGGESGERLAGISAGLAAAALFGSSAPFAKLLLPEASALALSAILYLGAGAALSIWSVARRERVEAGLQRADWPLLVGVIVLGGIAGPLLMLLGLERMSALSVALMLNLEAAFTILLAVGLFGEHLGALEALAAAAVVCGAVLVGLGPGRLHGDLIGAAEIAGACLAWGIDNNLSQRLSLRDPVAVARIKTLGAGACTLAVALALGCRIPTGAALGGALAVGALCYGASLVLDMRALRILGSAREAAFFATAPFMGAMAAVFVFGRAPRVSEWTGGVLMAAGAALLMRERHAHLHTHEELEHEHLHVHDEHHLHPHCPPATEPHSHPHRHTPLTHDHPHLSDLHHRHVH
jgi:drug/metabolite transporter (DMT)-like permease